MSDSLQPQGLYSSWNSPGQNTGVGSSPSSGNLPNAGIEPSSPTLQVDSLPAEPPGKPIHGLESESEVTQSCLTLRPHDPAAYRDPPSMGFSSQEYWSGLPFPSLGDLPNPEIEPRSPAM